MGDKKIAFVGGGNMARHIVLGLIAQGYDPARLYVANRSADKLKLFATKGMQTTQNNRNAVADADIVMLAVKPKQLPAVCREIQNMIAKHQPLVISLAAGVSMDLLQQWLGDDKAIIRAMPNSPAEVGMGATALYAGDRINAEQKQLTQILFEAMGLVIWLEQEQHMDIVTALSGSGPAYIFLVIEALQQAGERLGLPAKLARQLSEQTVLGAAQLAIAADQDVIQLRQAVTSPNGTTEQALKVLMAGELKELFAKALAAATKRGQEISQSLSE